MIFEIYADENDRIIMTNPSFEMYAVYSKMYAACPVRVDYKDDYIFSYEEYLSELRKGAK